jgi:uncharacterized membrane protein required for colicin V production
MNGFVSELFSFLAFFVGIYAAVYLSETVAKMIDSEKCSRCKKININDICFGSFADAYYYINLINQGLVLRKAA